MRQFGRGAILGAACAFLVCTAAPLAAKPTAAQPALDAALAAAAEASPGSPGLAARVLAPRYGIDWRGAAGPAGAAPDSPFRIASVTKVFTAAAILRLMEDGRLGLAQPIAELIAPQTSATLAEAGYDPKAITVHQLLTHTSGLRDYAADPAYQQAVLSNPAKRWTRAEQIAFALSLGPAYGKPGAVHHYSDTGYILLGEILERQTGLGLAESLRTLLAFDKIGLKATWLETLEAPPKGAAPRARQLIGDLDTTNADPSFDLYGGGGLVSTVDDLALFFRALFRGEVFKAPSTLTAGLTLPSLRGDSGVRPALVVPIPVGSHACMGHGGFFGTLATHCPALDLTVIFTENNAVVGGGAQSFLAAVAGQVGAGPPPPPPAPRKR